jgi:serine/threonine protein kinase
MKHRPVPTFEAEEMLIQIADALEYAVEHCVVHRNFTPASVKIVPEDQIKMLGLALAKALTDPVLTASGGPETPTNLPRHHGRHGRGHFLGTAAYDPQGRGSIFSSKNEPEPGGEGTGS